MNRAEALRIGAVIANRWWRHNKPIILSQQHIEKKKAWQQIKKVTQPTKAMSHKENTSKEMLPHEKRTFHSRSIFD
ncbi:hypothetical protein [Enterococcus faecium]|uniref:hypothetical protein n=1 Tax=Enterococcus faecium TaxID=1352 RepID=UPI00225DE921|nr:hypothetical protein [Enterococcus faecium]UZV52845.1 hypothetical protein OSG99_11615 [Enterococcus faecium]